MRVVVKPVEKAQQGLVDHRVVADISGELVELLFVRQISMQHQVRHLHEGALCGELLDRIAAVEEYTGLAVNVGNAAIGAGGGAESRIVGKDSQVALDRGDIDDRGTDGAAEHRKFGFFAGLLVEKLEFRRGHDCCCILMKAPEGSRAQRQVTVRDTGSAQRNQGTRTRT